MEKINDHSLYPIFFVRFVNMSQWARVSVTVAPLLSALTIMPPRPMVPQNHFF
jgi:hypothetical protein